MGMWLAYRRTCPLFDVFSHRLCTALAYHSAALGGWLWGMAMLGLGLIITRYNGTGTCLSVPVRASDYWCRSIFDRLHYLTTRILYLLYYLIHLTAKLISLSLSLTHTHTHTHILIILFADICVSANTTRAVNFDVSTVNTEELTMSHASTLATSKVVNIVFFLGLAMLIL